MDRAAALEVIPLDVFLADNPCLESIRAAIVKMKYPDTVIRLYDSFVQNKVVKLFEYNGKVLAIHDSAEILKSLTTAFPAVAAHLSVLRNKVFSNEDQRKIFADKQAEKELNFQKDEKTVLSQFRNLETMVPATEQENETLRRTVNDELRALARSFNVEGPSDIVP